MGSCLCAKQINGDLDHLKTAIENEIYVPPSSPNSEPVQLNKIVIPARPPKQMNHHYSNSENNVVTGRAFPSLTTDDLEASESNLNGPPTPKLNNHNCSIIVNLNANGVHLNHYSPMPTSTNIYNLNKKKQSDRVSLIAFDLLRDYNTSHSNPILESPTNAQPTTEKK
eukprot:297633_1